MFHLFIVSPIPRVLLACLPAFSHPQRSYARFPVRQKTHARANHLLTVPYSEEHIATCPVRAVEQLVRATCPVRAAGQRTHTRWMGQEQRVFVSNRTPPAREAGGWPGQGSQPFSETNVAYTEMSPGRPASTLNSLCTPSGQEAGFHRR